MNQEQVRLAINKLEEQGWTRPGRITGDYYNLPCPIHKSGTEKRPSCGILLHDQYKNGQKYPAGFFHCFTCSFAKAMPDAITEILHSKGDTRNGEQWLAQYVDGYDADSSDFEYLLDNNLTETIDEKFAVRDIVNRLYHKQEFVSEEELAKYRFTVPYMYQRGMTDELIEKFDIGFDPNFILEGRKKPTPCITMPVRDIKGRTLFFCRRSIEGKMYHYPQGVTKPVWGIGDLPSNIKSVVICESIINAITSWKYGKPAVALMGTGNTFQIEQLKKLGASEFIIGLDPDEAGRRGTEKLKKALSSVAMVWSYVGIPEGKDINDLTQEEYLSLEVDQIGTSINKHSYDNNNHLYV